MYDVTVDVTNVYNLSQVDIFNNAIVDATYKQNNKKCKLTFAQESITYFSPMTYGFTKNGQYNEAFDEM